MAICGLIMCFVKIWAKDLVLDNLYSKQIVIELFLYKIYISCYMDVSIGPFYTCMSLMT